MSYDIIIVGAGPAGLACARTAALGGMKPLIIERNKTIGKKVCAGGITWNGLIDKIPGYIAEREFPVQLIYSKWQKATVYAKNPIIATVNRQKLGRYMAAKAMDAGAEIRTFCNVKGIEPGVVTVFDKKTGSSERIKFNYLVGADGSTSIVRRYLGIPVLHAGIGINYQIPGEFSHMEWHFNSSLFANGYAWVFPHATDCSVGSYVDAKVMKPKKLQFNTKKWAKNCGISLKEGQPQAEFINFDYKGWCFDNIFLAGDAAGLASGLTGEGIYPAIVSGEEIARYMTNNDCQLTELNRLLKMNKRHRRMVSVTKNRFLGPLLSELIIFSLRIKLINFKAIEMAN